MKIENKEKLELKHIAPYLPYELSILVKTRGNFTCDPEVVEKTILTPNNLFRFLGKKPYRCLSQKLLLKPLSDLIEDEEFYESFYTTFIEEDNIGYLCESKKDISRSGLSYSCLIFLIENHFDVFGLIEKGLAEPIK
ncbi:hypothetical protein Phi4:1_gp184 [Cellulophaga phage phi4:1]|uniref:Uncharacterized protein n=3 Tax=Lightbulbvirus Cba41 TaxID=1918524 RepID=A0A0S2MWU3_9CAUD|nr:hypothetical protein Phi4:1_gp184 [Cellulophaga phage phi4:1]AGO49597.1 hypothetical protein Phi4:1_gp184 [Cellulophaga phage phi4:1]ALO80193.1 hypothetical protein Phi4113_184 [Cellulophaga phage phi4:1_13]ALO80390.1 hypothetical protein Phi4118_184 [Cellulophaga phage phi4:1_18]